MPTQPTRNVLPVFLASPGDVTDERQSAREIADTINRIYSRELGWQVELLGWEDTLPGAGRPQELINADVDACDLFVGVVWARWGSPTGKFASGFEEEFERALARYRETGSPEIWLFFKEVHPDRLRDPGPQLQRVLSFRTEQISRREVFFKEFTDDNQWRDLFHEALSRYLLKVALPQLRGPSASPSPDASSNVTAPRASEASLPPEGGTKLSAGHAQLRALAGVITDAIENSGGDGTDRLMSLDQFEVGRLYLFASVLMIGRYNNNVLGVHEINTMYLHKERFDTTGFEKSLILRTLIGDANDTIPGCYWFRDFPPDDVPLFLSLFTDDRNPAVRLGALQILENLNVSPSAAFVEGGAAFMSVLKDEEYTVRKAAFSYLASAGTAEDLPLLDSLASDEAAGSLRNEVIFARAAIIAKTDPERAFSELLANPQLDAKEFLPLLDRRAGEIETATLLSAVKNSSEAVREFVVRELRRRGALTVELAASMLEDPSEAVKEICYLRLIEQGERVDPRAVLSNLHGQQSVRRRLAPTTSITSENNPNAVIMQLLRGLSLDELTKLIDWYEFLGTNAYKARGLFHFDAVAGEIRADLEDGFARIKQESDERIRVLYGSAAEELIKKVENFTRAELTVAALTALAENGEPDDILIGRKYLTNSDDDIAYEAVRIVERLGSAADAEALVEVARRNSYSRLGSYAARVALRLSPGIDGAAPSLVMSDSSDLVQAAVTAILDEDRTRVTELIKPLLYHSRDGVRLKTLAFFVKRFTEEELEALLTEYTQATHYFYNVVCHLDRVLYAPPPLRELCRQDIESELDEQAAA